MRLLVRQAKHRIVISTPERDLIYPERSAGWFGPPSNPAHVREWRMDEFSRFIRRFMAIESHTISNREQGTQMIIGSVRD